MSRIVPLAAAFALGLATASAADVGRPHHIQSLGTAPTRVSPSGQARVKVLASKEVGGAQSAFVAVLEMDPAAVVPEHRDATEEFVFFLDGGGDISIDGTKSAVVKDDLVFMPANSLVTFTAGKEPVRVLQVWAPQGPEAKYEKWTAK